MNSENSINKPHIAELKFGNVSKRLYLINEEGCDSKALFQKACDLLNDLGESCISWDDYYDKAIDLFRDMGFHRVEK